MLRFFVTTLLLCLASGPWAAGIETGDPTMDAAFAKMLDRDFAVKGQGATALAQSGHPQATELLRGVLEGRLRYLKKNKSQNGQTSYEVRPALRNLITFKYLNLMEPWPFRGPFDFIFCRNVMIYFDKATQQQLVNRFWELLNPNGIFFTGHSESLTGIQHRFTYVQPTIYRKS